MKFDCSVLNPPFNGNIDLQFIKKAIELTKPDGNIMVVHPAISTITRKSTSRYAEYKKILDKHVKNVKIFNGNPVFGIGLFYPCQIVHITPDKSYESFPVEYDLGDGKHTDTFTTLFDVTKWGKVPEYYSLEKKILEYCNTKGNCEDKLGGLEGDYKSRNIKGNFYINLAAIRGNIDKATMIDVDFYTMPTKELVVEKTQTKNMWFGCKTKLEAENILKYLKTDFARFCLSIYKTNGHLNRDEMKGIPYFPSYSEEWTKERITTELGISDNEWSFIEKVIPPYYT